MTESALGNVLMLTKSGSSVHLDWSADAGTGPYVVKRSTSWDFTGAAAIGAPQPGKSFDDPVLSSGTDYAYRIFRRSLTDTLSYYHADHLGTPIAMTNGAAALTWRAEHYPFGGIYSVTGGGSNNLRFPGQYADSETGMYQNFHRDYVPWLGRYAEVDPVGGSIRSPGAVRIISYGYGAQAPLIKSDPRGLLVITGSLGGPDSACVRKLASGAIKSSCCDIPDDWADPSKPPYVQPAPPSMKFSGGTCGTIGNGPSWVNVFINNDNPDCWENADCCKKASLVIHEILHLNRKDTTDNEVKGDFRKCSSGCVKPGKYK